VRRHRGHATAASEAGPGSNPVAIIRARPERHAGSGPVPFSIPPPPLLVVATVVATALGSLMFVRLAVGRYCRRHSCGGTLLDASPFIWMLLEQLLSAAGENRINAS